MLSVGKTIVYPYQGPCLIGAVVKKVVGGRPTSFYQLDRLDEIGGVLLVPVDKIGALKIRQLMTKSDIPKLLRRLKKPASTVMNWKQRAIDNLKLLASGSPLDLADVVESLTELNEAKTLSARDREMLDRARRILICEISEVMGETKSAAEQQVDQALNMRKKHQAIGRKKGQCAGHNAATGAPITEKEFLWQVKPLRSGRRKRLGARENRRRLPASWSAETRRQGLRVMLGGNIRR